MTSGSVDFSVNRNEIITDAMLEAGAIGVGETPTADEITTVARRLNMLVKSWQGQTDFAPGLKVWTRRRGTLFLQKNQYEYTLGPSGDNWADTFVETTTTATASSGASAIAVASATGISGTYFIGIELVTGFLQWTTVSSVVSLTVNLGATLTADVASGATVYCYQTKGRRPLSLVSVLLRNYQGNDFPMYDMKTAQAYDAIPVKSAPGTPVAYYYEAALPNGRFWTDVAANDVDDKVRITYLSAVEDFDASTDDPDYPQEWYRALVMGLAKEIGPSFGKGWTPVQESTLVQAMTIARQANAERVVSQFEPELE